MTLASALNPSVYDGRPAIDRWLTSCDKYMRGPASRARVALDPWLANISQSPWPGVAWRFSRLTRDGFPFELVFSSLDPSIRYTIEVSGPERRAPERLPAANTQMAQMGLTGLEPSQLQSLIGLQARGVLRFGCWLGGRHSENSDRYKLYVEVPEQISAADSMGLLAAHSAARFPAEWRPRMIGIQPGEKDTELYFAGPEIKAWEITQLPRYAGLPSASAALLDLVREAAGNDLPETFPAGAAGWSFAFQADDQVAYSFFCFARYLWKDDRTLFEGLERAARGVSWDLTLLRQVAPTPREGHPLSRHYGMVSFVATAGGALGMGIGLRPPDPS